ncbi:MAG TPA: hypothetical protein VNP92_27325 [Actinophytocola sp.]|nr:hypothetical protein [Actinophytocola sp.]
MSPEDEDVKALLGRALGDEPPLRLDRDEVFRQGRRKLRNRRRFEAGGAVAGVVAAVVGAVLLTNLVADDEPADLPPAATRTDGHLAPPGPTLPLTTTTSEESPPVSATVMSQAHADLLTTVLLDAKVLAELKLRTVDGADPAFLPVESTYELVTDVQSDVDVSGSLSVSVGIGDPARPADCKLVAEPYDGCTVQDVAGMPAVLAHAKDYDTGEKRTMMYIVRADGTTVTAIATNLSNRRRADSKPPTDGSPLVTEKMLLDLAGLDELRHSG